MSWRALFGVDLSGKLSAWKRRYQGDVRTFDHRNVWCRITSWRGGIHTVSASVRCTDPNANMDTRPIAWIYNVDGFTSRVEAEAHIEAEIRKATRKHKDTNFFRYHLANPRKALAPGETAEYCRNGVWYQGDYIPPAYRCPECGYDTDERPTCPRCGGLVF